MRTRSKLALITLAGAVAASGVGVTQSWFVSLNRTPPGVLDSAVVHYLPETGVEQTLDELLRYGNLMAGVGLDEEGVAHVLPGENLLSTVTTAGTGSSRTRTVATTRVRDYRAGESVGSVINTETRSYTVKLPGEKPEDPTVTETRRVAKTRRDLLRTEVSVAGDPDLDGWELTNVVTGREETAREGGALIPGVGLIPDYSTDYTGATVTTTAVTSTYVKAALTKTVTVTTVNTVYHEAERYTGGTPEEFAGGHWIHTMAEEVLGLLPVNSAAPESAHTRLTVTGPANPSDAAGTLPLSVGNRSTAATNLRVGAAGSVTYSGDSPVTEALELRQAGGSYYLGLTDAVSGKYIELVKLTLASGWVQARMAAGESLSANLWDLNLTDPADAARIPAVADREAEPDVYQAFTEISVATKSNFGVSQEDFETSFNRLYNEGSPLIQLTVRFYAKQADYMDWAEFYKTEVALAAPARGVTP